MVERDGTKYLEMFDFDSTVFSDLTTLIPSNTSHTSKITRSRLSCRADPLSEEKSNRSDHAGLMDTEGVRVGYDKLETHEEVITEGDVRVRIGGGYERGSR